MDIANLLNLAAMSIHARTAPIPRQAEDIWDGEGSDTDEILTTPEAVGISLYNCVQPASLTKVYTIKQKQIPPWLLPAGVCGDWTASVRILFVRQDP
ncbi:MAG: hypothetical protein QNJ40_05895 [Xanthomonadales bacterium]|nr:hypothetical protein [Xanthomonadales bacterium]